MLANNASLEEKLIVQNLEQKTTPKTSMMKIQLFLGLTFIALALGGKLYLIKSFMLNVSVFAINVSEKHSPLGTQNIFPEECLH